LPFEPWRYFSFDVIGDPKATRANHEELLRRGFAPVPVFQRSTPIAELDRYFEGTDLVGCAVHREPAYVNGLMRAAKGRAVHWLGFCTTEWIKAHRPYSVDASTFSVGARYGAIPVYFGHGKIRQIRQATMAGPMREEIMSRLTMVGVDTKAILDRGGWKDHAMDAGARGWLAFALDVEANIGTRVFLACTQYTEVQRLRSVYADLTARGFGRLKETTRAA